MLEGATSIVARLVDLSSERRASRRVLFEDFIEPVYLDLRKVHDDLIDNFVTYEAMVQKSPGRVGSDHALVRRLTTDFRTTAADRAELRAELRGLFDQTIRSRDLDVVGRFRMSAVRYLQVALAASPRDILLPSMWLRNARIAVRDDVARLPGGSDPDAVLKKLRTLSDTLGSRFHEVAVARSQAKGALLGR